jgi:hypothetical protein
VAGVPRPLRPLSHHRIAALLTDPWVGPAGRTGAVAGEAEHG